VDPHLNSPSRSPNISILYKTMSLILIIIIITLFQSQIILAKHKCSTNWGDCKSNQIKSIKSIKSNQMLVFEERGKPEYPEKNLTEQSREPTNSVHIWRRVRESNPGHIGGRRARSPIPTFLDPYVGIRSALPRFDQHRVFLLFLFFFFRIYMYIGYF